MKKIIYLFVSVCIFTHLEIYAADMVLMQENGAPSAPPPPRFLDQQNNNGNTALMLAILKEEDNIALSLLKSKVDPNIANQEGETPLMIATHRPPTSRGIPWWSGKPPFLDVFYALLKARANVNARTRAGKTALMFLVGRNRDNRDIDSMSYYKEMFKTLLQEGADVNAQTQLGVTALMLSIQAKNDIFTSLLLKNRANPTLENENKENALMLAIKNGDTENAKDIIAKSRFF